MNTDEPLLQFDETSQPINGLSEHSSPRPLPLSSSHPQQRISDATQNIDDSKCPLVSVGNDASNLIEGFDQLANGLSTVTHGDNDCLARSTNASDLADDRRSLISLTSDSSGSEDILRFNEAIDIHHEHDDLAEVNLLADSSMDSRESQPLLGGNHRDAHDFVYNCFPGEYFVWL